MILTPQIFRAYDIRGVVGQDFDAAGTHLIARAYATFMVRRFGARQAVVGRDNRPSSKELQAAFIHGLRRSGLRVVDIGLAPSPLLYYAVAAWGMAGGANVTASHNPREYNGFKLVGRGGLPLSPEEIQTVRAITESGDFAAGEGGLKTRAAAPGYLAMLEDRFRVPRPLRVVVDPGNAVATLTGPAALRRIGCEVQGINLELDGRFPAHLPDPQDASTVQGLQQGVRAQRADLGLAWDGDGDRLGVVDETGALQTPDAVFALLARDVLRRHAGARILADVKMSRMATDDITAHGGAVVFGASGHSLMKRRMRSEGLLLGGEASGHFYFGEDYYGFDDAVYAACALTRLVSASGGAASRCFEGLPRYVTSPEITLPCPDDEKFAVVRAAAARLGSAYPVLEIDGARVQFDGGWALVRASNTSPRLSVRVEAESEDRYVAIREEVWDVLRRFPAIELRHGDTLAPERTPR